MPPKGKGADKGAKKAVLPPFYAFGKLNKNGQISDKKGAAALARASVAAGRVLGRLVPVRAARREFARVLQHRWQSGAMDIQRCWRAHVERGILRPWLSIGVVVDRGLPGHVRRARNVQRLWRGHVARKRVAWGDTPKWHAAATKLQNIYRGSVTRQLSKQLQYVRCVPAAFMLVAMALVGDSGVLRRAGAGKYRTPAPLKPKAVPTKPLDPRPSSTRPVTQATIASTMERGAAVTEGQDAVDENDANEKGEGSARTAGKQLEQELARAMQLTKLFLDLQSWQVDLAWNYMDASKDGGIERAEVARAARSAQLGELCIDMFFALADTNGDGVVDRREFDSAIEFARLFFAGRLLDENQSIDVVREHKIRYLQTQLVEYQAETCRIVERLKDPKVKLAKRAREIYDSMTKAERQRVARVNRAVIQEAAVYLHSKEERVIREDIRNMGIDRCQVREWQDMINQLKEDIAFDQYFVLRSPCRERQLSRAEIAAIEAQRLAEEEEARQERLRRPATLRITVLQARHLSGAGRSSSSENGGHLYVRLIAGGTFRKTTIQESLDPVWNEDFELLLEPVHRRSNLRLECFDFNPLCADTLLGVVMLPLEKLEPGKTYVGWLPLRNQSGISGDGEIQLRYELVSLTDELAEAARNTCAQAEAPAILDVTVVRGIDLLAADGRRTRDPYVNLQVGKATNTVHRTSTKKQTRNPEWNQSFIIRLEGSQRHESLLLECFDHNTLSSNNSCGKLQIPLKSLVLGQKYRERHNLMQAGVTMHNGQLELEYRLVQRNQSQLQATLLITVLRAKDLIASDHGGTSDPYVRLHVGQAVRAAKRTKTKMKTLDPVFGQTFKFRLDAAQRQQNLTIECFDYDMLGSDDSLGKILLPIDTMRVNEETQEWLKLQQDDRSQGEIEVRYTIEEKTASEVENEEQMLKPGILYITVVRARDLLAADSNGMSDPFIKLHTGNTKEHAQKTDVMKKTLNPVWNETFTFNLDRKQRQDDMTFECFDYDLLSSNDSLGSFDLPLDSLLHNQECVQWYRLEQEEEDTHQGEVEVRYTFVPSTEEECLGPVSTPNLEPGTARWCGGPAILRFTVICAQDLLAADRGGTSDPYLTVKIGTEMKDAPKTKVITKTLNPVWNETFQLSIDSSIFDQGLTMECFDSDLIGSDDSLGKVVVNLATLTVGQDTTRWYDLIHDSGDQQGRVQVTYKLVPQEENQNINALPFDLASQVPLAVENATENIMNVKDLNIGESAEAEASRQLEEARERMVLHSCSLFRLVIHPAILPSSKEVDMEKVFLRKKTIEHAQDTAVIEIRVAMREGDSKFAEANKLLEHGHFQDSRKQLHLAQLCYEYADHVEREANIFYDLKSDLVVFDEGSLPQDGSLNSPETPKIIKINNLHAEISTAFNDSMRGSWPLHKAAAMGSVGTVTYLIKKLDERVECIDRAGKTALHVAVENSQVEVVRLLIMDFGANPARPTFTGRSPMHIASDSGDQDTMRSLFEACAARITMEIQSGQRDRITKEQISAEALSMLGTWRHSKHGNSALDLAANKLHSNTLHVYSLVLGLEEEQERPRTRKDSALSQRSGMDDGIQGGLGKQKSDLSRTLSRSSSVSSVMSMDEDQAKAANAELLQVLGINEFDSQKMAPFAPALHWTQTSDLELDLMQYFDKKDEEHAMLTARRNRPRSASSAGSSSRASTAGSSGEAAAHLAMLRGEFHVQLTVEEGRNMRMRTQHAEPSVCVDISWLPASRHNKRQEQVHKRTRIRKHTSIPLWSAIYDFDVDPEGPEGWNMLEFLVRDVHTNDVCSSRTCLCKTDAGFEDFLGAITIDMSDLVFGVTEGWYALEDNVDLRGDEVSAKARLRLGEIRPMRPIQGEVYLKLQVTNPVSHLPAPPPKTAAEIYEQEVMAQVIEENRGASSKRRKMIITDMWDRMLADQPRAMEPYTKTLEALQKSHVDRMNEQLLMSCVQGEVIAIHYCLKQGAEINRKDEKTQTPLLLAARYGHDECVEALLEYLADVHACNQDGATPLYQAAANGHAKVIERLVHAKADLEARTVETMSTPLLVAARNGKHESIRALLSLNADINARNAMGACALHLATFASHSASVRILLEEGSNIKASIKKGALQGTVPLEVSSSSLSACP